MGALKRLTSCLLIACGARTSLDVRELKPSGLQEAGTGVTDASAETSAPITITTYIGDERLALGFVAAQDGDGAWAPLHSTDGVYAFDAESRYGIVYECTDSVGGHGLSFLFATRERYTSLVVGCDAPPSATGVIGVTVTGLGAGEAADVAVDSLNVTLVATPINLHVGRGLLLAGDHDVVVSVWNNGTLERMGIRRAVQTGADLSFDAVADATTPAAFQLGMNGATSDEQVEVDATFLSSSGTVSRLSRPTTAGYFGTPSALLAPSDLHVLSARAANGTTREARQAVRYAHHAADLTLTLPPLFTADAGAQPSTSHVRVAAHWTSAPNANLYRATWSQPMRWISFAATSAWLSNATSWNEPDLSSVDGWSDAAELAAGATTTWSASATASDRDPLLELEHFPISEPVAPLMAWDAASVLTSTKAGWFTP